VEVALIQNADIDLYAVDWWRAALALLRAEAVGAKVVITAHGYHLYGVPRWYAFDDPMRWEMDEERARHGLPTGVLFIGKCGRRFEDEGYEKAWARLESRFPFLRFWNRGLARRWLDGKKIL